MPRPNQLILGFSLLKFLFHFLIAAFAGYEIFRDELYYLACVDHLAWGYIDQPPLSIWVLKAFTSILGDSILSIRLIPAIAGGLSMYFLGKSVKELGGANFAIAVASLAYLISPINLGFGSIYSMNCLDLLAWILSYYLVIRLIRTEDKKIWIYLGIVLGCALMNKISILFLGAGLAIAIVATPLRAWLKTPWPYIGGAIALLSFTPYLWWNITHDMAHLEFIGNATSQKYDELSAWSFLSGQFLINHPTNFLIYLLGIFYFIFDQKGKKFRALGIIFFFTMLILMINGQSKSEYLAGAISILFGGGALWLEDRLNHLKWLKIAILILLVSGMALAPLAAPMLNETSFIRYSQKLGIGGSNNEGKEESELPQFYADMHGWEQKAKAVSLAFQNLSMEEKKHTIIFTQNYGRAGSMDYFNKKYDLPPSYSGHNNYWLWGPPPEETTTVIFLQQQIGGAADLFETIEEVGKIQCEYCMPYENNLKVFIARNPNQSIGTLWPELKNYN